MGNRTPAIVSSTLLIGACHEGVATPAVPAPTVQVVEVVQQDVPIYGERIGTLDAFGSVRWLREAGE